MIIGSQVLRALGHDNVTLLAATSSRFDGLVDVPELLLDPEHNENAGGSLRMLRENDWQASHSAGAGDSEEFDDDDIYIDLGEGSADDISKALKEAVEKTCEDGLSESGFARLHNIFHEYRPIFRIRLGKSRPADVISMQLRVTPGKHPVKERVRKYSPKQSRFLDAYVDQMADIGFLIPNPNASWKAAPLLVSKTAKAQF